MAMVTVKTRIHRRLMRIAVDFDGTIVEDRYPGIGKPVPYAFETLISLQKSGHRIILWTVREGKLLQEAVDFCRGRGLEFFAVNSEMPADWEGSSPRKLRADIYIDDRSVGGLPDWGTIEKIICGENFPEESSCHRPHYSSGGKRKRGFLGRIADRCRRSREKFG